MPEKKSPSEIRSSLIKYASSCLSHRPYFSEVLRRKLVLRAKKLRLKNYQKIVEKILKDLDGAGYLDDTYLAQAFARRQLDKGYGPKVISLKLKRLKLSQTVVNQALDEVTHEKQLEAIKKYTQKYRKIDPFHLKSRLYARGFTSSVINLPFDAESFAD